MNPKNQDTYLLFLVRIYEHTDDFDIHQNIRLVYLKILNHYSDKKIPLLTTDRYKHKNKPDFSHDCRNVVLTNWHISEMQGMLIRVWQGDDNWSWMKSSEIDYSCVIIMLHD